MLSTERKRGDEGALRLSGQHCKVWPQDCKTISYFSLTKSYNSPMSQSSSTLYYIRSDINNNSRNFPWFHSEWLSWKCQPLLLHILLYLTTKVILKTTQVKVLNCVVYCKKNQGTDAKVSLISAAQIVQSWRSVARIQLWKYSICPLSKHVASLFSSHV